MVRLLLIALMICSISASATTYQIANQSAFDSFNWSSLVAGDNAQIAKGQSIYGSITLSQSGTSGSPITITSYGTGANPIITGFTTISAWTNLGSNIWESTNAVSTLSNCNMVTINGINTPMGRYPNTGYLTINSHNVRTSITCTSLTGTPDWTGAELVIRTSRWALDRVIASSQSTNTINYTGTLNAEPVDGYGFFIQNNPSTLDQQNEWYYNPTTHKIRIYSTTQPANVKIASVDNLLTLNGNYITIDGLAFEGANLNSIFRLFSLGAITYPTIQNCTFNFIGQNAIDIRASHAVIDSNTISKINNNAINCNYSSYVSVTNNTISDVAIHGGMGMTGSGNYTGITLYTTTNSLVQYNSIVNTGFNGIMFYGSSISVINNFVDTFNFILDDGGGIYTYTGGQAQMSAIEVKNNICINAIGAGLGTDSPSYVPANGLYFDGNSSNIVATGNTTAYCSDYGIFMNNPKSVTLKNNTSYDNVKAQIRVNCFTDYQEMTGNYFTNNIYLSDNISQLSAIYADYSSDIATFGTIDSTYYCKNTTKKNDIGYLSPTNSYAEYNLSDWKLLKSKDSNSTQKVITKADTRFEYNNTSVGKQITISSPMTDLKGNKYATTFMLAAYESIILIPDSNQIVIKKVFGQGKKQWKF